MKVKSERITDAYTITVQNGVAVLHHTPKSGFYFANLAKFQNQRREAYRELARSGRQDIRGVKGFSLVLDYGRDGFDVTLEKPKLMRDRIALFAVWTNNIYNWRISRFVKLIRHMRKKNLQVGQMRWEDFVLRFS